MISFIGDSDMDAQSIKNTIFSNSAPQGQKENAEASHDGIAGAFTDILKKSGGRATGAMNLLPGTFDFVNASDRVPEDSFRDDYRPQRVDDDQSRRDNTDDRGESHDNAPSDTSKEGHRDGYDGAPRHAEHNDERSSGEDHSQDAPRSVERNDSHSRNDTSGQQEQQEQKASTNNETSAKDETTARGDQGENGKTPGENGLASQADSNASAQAANPFLSGLMTLSQGDNKNKAPGLDVAKAKANQNSALHVKDSSSAKGGAQSALQNDGLAKGDTHGQQAKAQLNANGAKQAGASANQGQTRADQVAQTSTLAQQAAGLSKVVGDGGRLSVFVNLDDEPSALVSKPSSSLSSTALLANEGKGRSVVQGKRDISSTILPAMSVSRILPGKNHVPHSVRAVFKVR
jgi:hypothetical protein